MLPLGCYKPTRMKRSKLEQCQKQNYKSAKKKHTHTIKTQRICVCGIGDMGSLNSGVMASPHYIVSVTHNRNNNKKKKKMVGSKYHAVCFTCLLLLWRDYSSFNLTVWRHGITERELPTTGLSGTTVTVICQQQHVPVGILVYACDQQCSEKDIGVHLSATKAASLRVDPIQCDLRERRVAGLSFCGQFICTFSFSLKN